MLFLRMILFSQNFPVEYLINIILLLYFFIYICIIILYIVSECVCECVLGRSLKLSTVVRRIRTFHTHNYYADVCAGTYASLFTQLDQFSVATFSSYVPHCIVYTYNSSINVHVPRKFRAFSFQIQRVF